MEVAYGPQLFLDPAVLDARLECLQHGQGEITLRHCIESGFSGEHAALDRKVDALQALRIQETRGVAENHPAIARKRWYGPPAAVGQRLGAVAHHLSTFQQLGDKRVLLEFLQDVLRINPLILVVESSDESKRNNVFLLAV